MSRISITDVAEKAGVSISTASKAINGTGNISSNTIERVLKTAYELGYKPNRAAQFLSSKSKTIGIIIPDQPYQVFSVFESGLKQAMEKYEEVGFNYNIVHYSSMDDRIEFPAGINSFKGKANGIVFIPSYHLSEYSDCLKALDIPKISLQTSLNPEICMSVTVNEHAVGRIAAEFLSLGFCTAKVAAIVGELEMSIHKKNIEGFSDEALKRNLEVVAIDESFDDMKVAYHLTRRIINNVPDLNGIFVSSYVAPGVCKCLIDEGLTEKIRVIGVDVYNETADLLRSGVLSAVIDQNQKLQSIKAVDAIIGALRAHPIIENVKVKPELVLKSNLDYYI